jgi:hypothetical protein
MDSNVKPLNQQGGGGTSKGTGHGLDRPQHAVEPASLFKQFQRTIGNPDCEVCKYHVVASATGSQESIGPVLPNTNGTMIVTI